MSLSREEIIRMAHAAGLFNDDQSPLPEFLEHFANAAYEAGAAAEREACAKKSGEFARKWWSIHCASNKHLDTTRKAHDDFCDLQAAIRARGNGGGK